MKFGKLLFLNYLQYKYQTMKPDDEKSKSELIDELKELRSKLSEFESFQSEYERASFLAGNKEYQLLIAELSEDMFSLHNPEGDYIYASPACFSIIGYKPKELVGKSSYDFFHSEDLRRIAEHHERTTKGEKSHPVTYRLKHKNGNFIWVETTSRFVFKPDSDILEMIICVTRNITRQKNSYRKWEESEMRFRNIIEKTPIGMCITDKNGFFQYVNESYCNIYNYMDAELLGKHFTIIVPKDKRDHFTKKHDDFINGADEGQGIWKAIDKNNNEKIIVVDAVRITGTDGEIKKFTFVNDITEKEKFRQKLKESRELIDQISDSINEAFWLALAKDRRLEYMSPAFEKITGYSVDLIMEDYQFFSSIVHPVDKEKYFYENYEEDAFKGRSVTYRIIRKDGAIRWIRTSSTPIINKNGEIIKVAGVSQDVTDTYEVKDDLRQSELKYKMLFENSSDAILIHKIDENGLPSYFIDVNETACKYYGYTIDEFKKLTPKDIDTDFSPGIVKPIIKDLINNKKIVFNKIHKTKSGKQMPVEISSNLIILNQEHVVISLVRDITHIKNAEDNLLKAKEAAERLNQLKSVILANMSHELRTPLNAIINYAEILLHRESDDKNIELIAEIKESGQRLHKTLTTMLDLSKIESNSTRLNLERQSLKDKVQEMISYYKDQITKKDIYLKAVFEDESLNIFTDTVLFNEMFRQLIDNAIKFTKKGGITVTCSEIQMEGSYFTKIEIADTGIGIDPSNLMTIFEPFRQESEGSSRNYEGTGLGLTIVKRIVEILKGRLLVDSQQSKGSTFTILLPIS